MTDPATRPPASADEWDARYANAEQVWSGKPNTALVAEVGGLQPGRALDVGCGEGADSVWLAARGWEVVALDVSEVALGRAAGAAERSRVRVEWLHAGLLDAPLDLGVFDLVSALYPALLRSPGNDAERRLVAAVAPGGLLLVVHHADADLPEARAHGFDPSDYVFPRDVAACLDSEWDVVLDERRPRHVATGAGVQHKHDVVLCARRTR